ncbi:peptidoglycan-binding domain-containing protein [uncultured Erythrobacter sp.]|uniref:peptidoglycan-binding domain-containing protein n=1 Tax=uncultured Erythrobacter sp. TaxID=263913 RepID=UPI00262CFF0B|nr:peptidoglycan-binding domain-containing protein [uncultured Erythrobacter sp.]
MTDFLGVNQKAYDRTRLWVAGLMLTTVTFCLLFGTAMVQAETADRQFAVEGAGRASCAAYSDARENNPQRAARYLGFIEGYLTAANRYEPNTFDLAPWHTAEAFALILDQHCKQSREDGLAMVAQRLVVSMMPHRLASESELVELRQGEKSVLVYDKIIRRAQNQLARRGLFAGERDGKDSPEFREALSRFQQLARLDQSGIPDVATLWVLLHP